MTLHDPTDNGATFRALLPDKTPQGSPQQNPTPQGVAS
jgi:hypothetical protein